MAAKKSTGARRGTGKRNKSGTRKQTRSGKVSKGTGRKISAKGKRSGKAPQAKRVAMLAVKAPPKSYQQLKRYKEFQGHGRTPKLRKAPPARVVAYFQKLREQQTGHRPSVAAVLKNETFKKAWRAMQKSRGRGADSLKARAMVALGLRQYDWFWMIGETPK